MSAFGLLKEGKVGAAIVRVIETVFGVTVPAPLAELIDRLTSDAGLIAKSFAQSAWDAAAESDPLDQIIAKAVAAAVAEGKTDLDKEIADWVGVIDRNSVVAAPSPAPAPEVAS